MKLSDELKNDIVKRLLPLNPEKIILFGSYAHGKSNEESDIDLFLVKNIAPEKSDSLETEAKIKLLDIMYNHRIGIDILSASESFLRSRDDYFYKVDILQKSEVLYGKQKRRYRMDCKSLSRFKCSSKNCLN